MNDREQQPTPASEAQEPTADGSKLKPSECRHCGWLCAPNNDKSRDWYPLSPPAKLPQEASKSDAELPECNVILDKAKKLGRDALSPIERFILDYEPAEDWHAEEFRDDLRAVLASPQPARAGAVELSDEQIDAVRLNMGTGVHRELFHRIARAVIAATTAASGGEGEA